MLAKKIEEALNEQLNREIYSAYLYYSMSAYFESVNLRGFAGWMRAQAMEEMEHAHKFYNFINDRGGRVIMKQIAAPKTEWDSAGSVMDDTLEHEQFVTQSINNLVDLAIQEKDFATKNFLDWFVTEQVEEEASVDEIRQNLKLVSNSAHGLFMIDREIGKRTFTLPTAEEN